MRLKDNGCSCSVPIFTTLAGLTTAVCISWIFNHSVLWCILHGLFNWFYVAYKTVWYVVTNY
jgi:hypothetical protein